MHIEGRYQEVVAHLDAGRFDAMQRAARVLVEAEPAHGKGWQMLGLACLYLGEAAAALPALRRACELQPTNPEVWDYLGVALNFQAQFPAAAAAFARSVEIDSGRAETWVNLGKNEADRGRYAEALEAYDKAIAAKPELPDAHDNRSVALLRLKRPAEAVAAAERASGLAPTRAWPHINRGNALLAQRLTNQAITAFRRACELAPELASAWCNLANALQEAGQADAAISAGERAWRLAPADPQVLSTLGSLYAEAGRLAEAQRLLRVAVERRPDFAEAWVNLGSALSDPNEKVAAFRRAAVLRPDLEIALSSFLFHANYLPDIPAAELLETARRYGELLARRITPSRTWPNRRDAHKPLRVGMVSADLCDHPVAQFLDATLLAARGKGIEWIAYSATVREDATSGRLKERFELWRDVRGMSDEEMTAQVAADGVDILIDLSGHTSGHRLAVFAAKPAPVQATWLGYSGTTGVQGIDYVIADPHTMPPDQPTWTVEEPWRLPECLMSFTRPEGDFRVGEPPCLQRGFVTFGSFNNLAKVNDQVLDLWAQILQAVPQARLVLRARQLADSETQARVLARLAAQGVERQRVDLSGLLPTRELGLAEYGRVDIALDPFPYTGATTSAEALWMGVPVLTLEGDRFIARVGASFNRNLGLQDWIAKDKPDYVALAVRHAADPERLALLRRAMRDRGAASPLGNPEWFANQFTRALRAMWTRWCDEGTRK
jgi:protein O-GlcNAc transferase